jgi:hypothetical protein
MQSVDFHIRGVAPLICHNPRLADPLDPWTKAIAEISGKRKKTDKDHRELGRREFLGSLYHDGNRPYIPAANIERMLRDAAARSKKGKDVQAGAIVPEDAPIIYSGPTDPEELHDSGKFVLRTGVLVGRARVIRTRPCFRAWELKFSVLFDEEILNRSAIQDFAILAGRIIGLGSWRPRNGRFEVLS